MATSQGPTWQHILWNCFVLYAGVDSGVFSTPAGSPQNIRGGNDFWAGEGGDDVRCFHRTRVCCTIFGCRRYIVRSFPQLHVQWGVFVVLFFSVYLGRKLNLCVHKPARSVFHLVQDAYILQKSLCVIGPLLYHWANLALVEWGARQHMFWKSWAAFALYRTWFGFLYFMHNLVAYIGKKSISQLRNFFNCLKIFHL